MMTTDDQAQSVLIELIIGNDAWKYDSDFFYKDSILLHLFCIRKPKGVFHICQQFFINYLYIFLEETRSNMVQE